MNCRQLTEFLSDYVAGELPNAVSVEFEGHLTACPECHLFLEQYRATIILSAAAFNDAPPQLPEDLVRAILAALQKSS
jgi:anti-sigma factor RsiW